MNVHQNAFSLIPFILKPAFCPGCFCIFLPRVSSTLSTQFHIPFRMLIAYLVSYQQSIFPTCFGIRFALTSSVRDNKQRFEY